MPAYPLFCPSSLFFYLSLRPVFFICHSGLFFICHSGLRAGVQVNIDSLTTWIPGQARNNSYMSVIPRLRNNRPPHRVIPRFRKKTSRDLRISLFPQPQTLPWLTCSPLSFPPYSRPNIVRNNADIPKKNSAEHIRHSAEHRRKKNIIIFVTQNLE